MQIIRKKGNVSSKLKARILKESMISGCNLAALARNHKISVHTLYSWRKIHFHNRIEEPVVSNKFVEVSLDSKTKTTTAHLKKASLEFDGFTISIEGEFEVQHLNQIAQMGYKSC